MKPVIPDDPILMYSLEDEEEEEENGCEIDISRDINDEIENVSGERRKAEGDPAVVQVYLFSFVCSCTLTYFLN